MKSGCRCRYRSLNFRIYGLVTLGGYPDLFDVWRKRYLPDEVEDAFQRSIPSKEIMRWPLSTISSTTASSPSRMILLPGSALRPGLTSVSHLPSASFSTRKLRFYRRSPPASCRSGGQVLPWYYSIREDPPLLSGTRAIHKKKNVLNLCFTSENQQAWSVTLSQWFLSYQLRRQKVIIFRQFVTISVG